MKELIFDFETLSTDIFDGVGVDCSLYAFDRKRFLSDNPYTFNEIVRDAKTLKMDVKEQVKSFDYKIDPNTLDFWRGLEKKVRVKINPSDDDLSLKDFVSSFMSYIEDNGPVSYWWSRSNIFDPIFLMRYSKDTGYMDEFKERLYYNKVRDTRTYIDAKFDFSVDNDFVPFSDTDKWESIFKKHDSRHDIAADIMRIQAITRGENGLSEVNE